MITLLYSNGPTSRLADELPLIRSLGISVIQNYQYPCISTDVTAWLDACKAAGLKCLMSLFPITSPRDTPTNPDYTSINAVIAAYDSHPAVYGWNIDDETTAAAWGISSRVAVYDYIKARSSKPIHEVQYKVETGAYTPNSHDVYMLDVYPYIWDDLYTNPLPNLDTYLAGEYAKINSADYDKLMYIMQVYGWPGHGTGVVPPYGGVTGQWNVAKANPNWATAGIGFYTWLSGLDQTGDTYGYPWETGNEYLLSEIAAVCADILPTAAITVTGLVLTGSATTHTVAGTCAAGCIVVIDGTTWAITDEAGTSWTAVVSPGSHTFVASNGLETATVTFDTGPAIPASAISGAAGTALRVYDGSVKYIPLVATTEGNASFARFYDGVDTWAMAEGPGAVFPEVGYKGLDLSLQLTI